MIIRDHVGYDPETGLFHRLPKPYGHKAKVGPITKIRSGGYIVFRIGEKNHYAHRLAFSYMGKEIPPGMEVDHINGNRADNRWVNLRIVDRRTNQQNFPVHRKGRLPGAAPIAYGKFQAQIYVDGKQKHIGCFDTAEEAHRAYMQACAELNERRQRNSTSLT